MSEQPEGPASAASGASAGAGGSQAGASPDGSGAGASGASDTVEMAFSAFRVVLPAEIANQMDLVRVDEYCLQASVGDLQLFELACYDQHDAAMTEWRHRVYSLGEGVDPAGVHEVKLTINYITADGKHIAHWGDSSSIELAQDALLGFSDSQLIDCIEICAAADAGSIAWDPSVPMLLSDDGASYAGGSSAGAGLSEVYNASVSQAYGDSSPVPFWGVWASASKSLGECEGFVADARAAGWSEAAVYLTTDWGDLNSEPWYVVSLQRCDSQSAAEDAAARAQKDGYDGAYARYTGQYVPVG